jgi:hypothetical protein
MPCVHHFKHAPPDAILVDRTTPYGNKFRVDVYGRRECLRRYCEYIWRKEQFWLRSMMRAELAGCDLVCHCFPKKCHANIIIWIANGMGKRECMEACELWLCM